MRFTGATWLVKIQWCLGVPLASQVGGYMTSSNMNGSAEANNTFCLNSMSRSENRRLKFSCDNGILSKSQ